MTNKEYKAARYEAENAAEIFTFESWNGFSIYPNRYMSNEDIKDLRQEYKTIKATNNGYALDGFGGRAIIKPDNNGNLILQSYYTNVCRYNLKSDKFSKTWNGFSVTTLKHINIFRQFLGLKAISKREWIELATEV
jgi:hypothetical protein